MQSEVLSQVSFKWWLVETKTIRNKTTIFSSNLQLKIKTLFSVYFEEKYALLIRELT